MGNYMYFDENLDGTLTLRTNLSGEVETLNVEGSFDTLAYIFLDSLKAGDLDDN